MPVVTIINYTLVMFFIAILVFGSVLIYRHQPRSNYRNYLVGMLLFWATIFGAMIIKFGNDHFSFEFNVGVLNLPIILMGIPSFLVLVGYPAVALNEGLSKLKNWIMLCSPMIALVTIYMIVAYSMGVNPFYVYTSWDEFFADFPSVSTIFRSLIILLFIVYIFALQVSLWRVVPIYNRYIQENFADTSYNVGWVRALIKYIYVVSFFYMLMTFTQSIVVNMFYFISIIALFSYIIDRSLFYKTFQGVSRMRMKWSRKLGVYIVEEQQQVKSVAKPKRSAKSDDDLGVALDGWMESSGLFVKVDFTTKDILAEFPKFTQDELSDLFRSRGETFQSYVRRYRINKACAIMEHSTEDIYVKQLYGEVGFSHYSSFSRAFATVKGVSPSEYLAELKR